MVKSSSLSLLLCLFVAVVKSNAQIEKNSTLYHTIMAQDSLLFSVGFNTCNIEKFESLLSDDFEFFHDKSGISNKEKFLKDLKNGLCGNPEAYQARRELSKNSTEIYPLYNDEKLYGVIQHGSHSFYEKQANQTEKYGSTAKFTHVWILENNLWKLSKSLSFDHQSETIIKTEPFFFDNDEMVNNWLKELNIPTLGLGIIKNGKLNQIKIFGETAQSYNTIFNVASLTKPVTAMVALQLINEGKWNLDEPLYNYWIDPDIAHNPNHKKLTTRLVLSHQTGFSNWRWMNDDNKLTFDFEPGTDYQYSGEGFEYLRKALENKFKKTLDKLAQELVFKPFNMNNTSYIWNDNIDDSKFAIGYDSNGKAYDIFKHKQPNAADDLLTTIEDYGNFLTNILSKITLDKTMYHEMIKKQVTIAEHKHFGLGFIIYDLENGHALSHGGADDGVRTIAFILPETNEGIVIFTNSDNGVKTYEKLLTYYLGENGKKIIAIETK